MPRPTDTQCPITPAEITSGRRPARWRIDKHLFAHTPVRQVDATTSNSRLERQINAYSRPRVVTLIVRPGVGGIIRPVVAGIIRPIVSRVVVTVAVVAWITGPVVAAGPPCVAIVPVAAISPVMMMASPPPVSDRFDHVGPDLLRLRHE